MNEPILDACCGSRMMWFDKADNRAVFMDERRESYVVDKGTTGTIGRSPIVVAPDLQADFTNMPFENDSFHLVVFDPPHVTAKKINGTVLRCFGVLSGDWREMLRMGFLECFRVLKPNGTLIFKWAETHIKLSEVLALTPEKPLFGHKTSKHTRWVTFMKSSREAELEKALKYAIEQVPELATVPGIAALLGKTNGD